MFVDPADQPSPAILPHTDVLDVLLIDDDEDAYVLTRDLFEEFEDDRFRLEWVASFEDGIRRSRECTHAAYLVDYRLGARTGIDFLTDVVSRGCSSPVILITGIGDREVDMDAIRLGASDYLVKGQITAPLLERTILHAIEHKQYEEKLLSYINDLHASKAVIEANAGELRSLNEKLVASEQELRVLNANKDRLFHIISHDLRSPFPALLSFTELLANELETLSPEEIRRFATGIHRSASNIWTLLDNLLHWARMQRDAVELSPVLFHLHDTVHQVVCLMTPTAQEKHITIDVAVERDVIVFADPPTITSVLQNLLSNAIKFTPENGLVTITAERQDVSIGIAVRDTGIGITDSDMGKLFRMDMTHTTLGTSRERGTGLGLLLCKDLTEKNNGRIWIESTPGAGTTVHLTLPRY